MPQSFSFGDINELQSNLAIMLLDVWYYIYISIMYMIPIAFAKLLNDRLSLSIIIFLCQKFTIDQKIDSLRVAALKTLSPITFFTS